MRSVTEVNEERNSIEITIDSKGDLKTTVKLYFEGEWLKPVEEAIDANLHARYHYLMRKEHKGETYP